MPSWQVYLADKALSTGWGFASRKSSKMGSYAELIPVINDEEITTPFPRDNYDDVGQCREPEASR